MNIIDQFKKGWATSEFWVSLVAIATPIVALVSSYDLDAEGAATMIGLVFGAVGYATNRTWLKRKRIEAVIATPPPALKAGQPPY